MNRKLSADVEAFRSENSKQTPEIKKLDEEKTRLDSEVLDCSNKVQDEGLCAEEKTKQETQIKVPEEAKSAATKVYNMESEALNAVEQEGEGLAEESEEAKQHAEKKAAKATEVEREKQKVSQASKALDAARTKLREKEQASAKLDKNLSTKTKELEEVQKKLNEKNGDLKEKQSENEQLSKEVNMLASVMDLWRDRGSKLGNGVLILDEVDMILHPLRSELNFPIGKVANPILPRPYRWSFPMYVFEGLFWAVGSEAKLYVRGKFHDPDTNLNALKEAIAKGLAQSHLQIEPHLVLLNENWYHHEGMKECLANWAVEWVLEAQLLQDSTASQTVRIEKEDVRLFFIHGTECRDRHPGVMKKLETLSEQQTEKSMLLLQMINFGHDLLNSYIPHALSKVRSTRLNCRSRELPSRSWLAWLARARSAPGLPPNRRSLSVRT
eukprot:1291925-Rhodomonas_salina.2